MRLLRIVERVVLALCALGTALLLAVTLLGMVPL